MNKLVQIGISASGDEKRAWSNHGGAHGEYSESNEYTLTTEKNDRTELVLLFSLFSAFFKLDLRTQKQCYEKTLAIILSVPFGEKFHFAYLIFLIMLEVKDPLKFKEYFSFNNNLRNEKKALIKNEFSSSYNIRISERLYCAIDFVRFYSEYACADFDKIQDAIRTRRRPSAEVMLLESIKNNHSNLKQYEKWVLLACNLD